MLLTHSDLGDRRVPVEHGGAAAVVVRPRVAHRQSELVGLAGGVAVQREAAHPPRRAAVVVLRAARRARRRAGRRRARSGRSARRTNARRPAAELVGLAGQLLQRLGRARARSAPCARAAPAPACPRGCRDTHSARAGRDHAHDQPQHARRVRARGRRGRRRTPRCAPPGAGRRPRARRRRGRAPSPASPAASSSSARQPCTSPITSNGPVPARRSLHSGSQDELGRVDLLGPSQHVHRAEALAAQPVPAPVRSSLRCRAITSRPNVAVRPGLRCARHTPPPARPARSRRAARRAPGPARPAPRGPRAARSSRRRR